MCLNQWIRLNELYKLMESFFTNLKSVFELLAGTEKYSNKWQGGNIDLSAMCYTSMDLTRQALQTDGKIFFSNFRIIFLNYLQFS